MRPAVIIVDLVKDNMKPEYPISARIRSILPSVQKLIGAARDRGYRIVFACDSYLPDDFIFQGRMRHHAIQGTPGADVIDDLLRRPEDMVLHKRRFSAFFQTGLEETLRIQGIDTVVVAGVATEVCVLTTAMDGICHGFRVVVLEDCCTSHREDTHRQITQIYGRSPLEPLLRFMKMDDFLSIEAVDPRSHTIGYDRVPQKTQS
jgi:nicotinamidase-related amidase